MRYPRVPRISLGTQVIIGLVLGTIIGAATYHSQVAISTMSGLGTILLHLIQTIVMPIVVSCLTVGVTNIGGLHKLGRADGKTLLYFEVLAIVAIILGLIAANSICPGDLTNIHSLQGDDVSKYLATARTASKVGVWGTIFAVIPTNILKSISEGDMIPVTFFGVSFGLGIAATGEKEEITIQFLNTVSGVMLKVTSWVMKFALLGVFGLIGMTITQMGLSALLPLGYFTLVAYLTMTSFYIVILGLVAYIFELNYWEAMKKIWPEISLASSTAGFEATLPRLVKKMQNTSVEKSAASLVVLTGYTFNLDGSATYRGLAVISLAQAYGLHLTREHQFTLLAVLMITSKKMAGVPGISFVVLLASVATIEVPTAGLTFIAGIDRFVDMGRTGINVVDNTFASLVIGESEKAFDYKKYERYLDK